LKILHHEELYNLYFSANIFRNIKSREMRILGHIACMGERRNAWEKQKEKTTRKT
jgi:hypothetical protein